MAFFPNLHGGLARSISLKKGKSRENDGAREAANLLVKEAKKNGLMCPTGTVKSCKSRKFASVHSKRGTKGINQDCSIVWEEYGCQEDIIFCGIFDGHGPWGHLVAKWVKKLLPSSLLCRWQEALTFRLHDDIPAAELDDDYHTFNIWNQAFLTAYTQVDQELKQHHDVNCFQSGSTALTIVKQGEHLFIANLGDCRAVLAAMADDGILVPIQLTVDFKPNLPQEEARIKQSRGQVFCMQDEPGLYRVWMPNGKSPGLAVSRAFGDYCIKDFGLISVPDVSHHNISRRDQFVILATDGVWDVTSNQEAIDIVSSTPKREQSAKRLVEFAASAWKRRRRGIERDDISAICLFFHPLQTEQPDHSTNMLKDVALEKPLVVK